MASFTPFLSSPPPPSHPSSSVLSLGLWLISEPQPSNVDDTLLFPLLPRTPSSSAASYRLTHPYQQTRSPKCPFPSLSWPPGAHRFLPPVYSFSTLLFLLQSTLVSSSCLCKPSALYALAIHCALESVHPTLPRNSSYLRRSLSVPPFRDRCSRKRSFSCVIACKDFVSLPSSLSSPSVRFVLCPSLSSMARSSTVHASHRVVPHPHSNVPSSSILSSTFCRAAPSRRLPPFSDCSSSHGHHAASLYIDPPPSLHVAVPFASRPPTPPTRFAVARLALHPVCRFPRCLLLSTLLSGE